MENNNRTIIMIVILVAVLAIIGYALGLFGGADDATDPAAADGVVVESSEPEVEVDMGDLTVDEGTDGDIDADEGGVDLPEIEVETTTTE